MSQTNRVEPALARPLEDVSPGTLGLSLRAAASGALRSTPRPSSRIEQAQDEGQHILDQLNNRVAKSPASSGSFANRWSYSFWSGLAKPAHRRGRARARQLPIASNFDQTIASAVEHQAQGALALTCVAKRCSLRLTSSPGREGVGVLLVRHSCAVDSVLTDERNRPGRAH